MKSLAAALLAVVPALVAACACSQDPQGDESAAPRERTLIGQVVLPSGSGSRGVEVLILVAAPGEKPHTEWVLFDEDGRIAHPLRGRLTRVSVTAGSEVQRIDGADLPAADPHGQVDVGVIDLRDRLTRHPLKLRAADGQPAGDVRVGMWFGPPPVGSRGEPVSLGSRQFSPIELGTQMEWLLPRDAHSIHFLVERPADSSRGTRWRSGRQQSFGPFTLAEFPAELVVE
jgi:hypothetical protein